jgi:hypothetical protein
MTRKINHVAMEPQIERCVSHVHAFVISPAFRHTVTTTYYREQKKTSQEEEQCHDHQETLLPPQKNTNETQNRNLGSQL